MIELASVISDLRTELSQALEAGKGSDLRFELGDIELDVQIAVQKATKAGGKVRFWVIDLGGESSVDHSSTQRIKLTLKPTMLVEGVKKKAYVSGEAVDGEK